MACLGRAFDSLTGTHWVTLGEVQRRKRFKYRQALEKDDLSHEDSTPTGKQDPDSEVNTSS